MIRINEALEGETVTEVGATSSAGADGPLEIRCASRKVVRIAYIDGRWSCQDVRVEIRLQGAHAVAQVAGG